MRPNPKYRADLFALVAYLLLAMALTYPLIFHFTTRVAGDGSDDPALAWNLWWVPYAILNLNTSPIYTDYMFYPIGLNLAFYTLTYLNAFLSIPIQFAFNVIAAANVNLLLSFALGGFGTYLLVKYLFQVCRGGACPRPNLQIFAAFAAGALDAFSSNKMLYASLGQFNIASSHWIPFYILFLLKLTALRPSPHALRHSIRLGFLLGLFLLFQALSEFIHASFLIIFTALYLAYWLIANRATHRVAPIALGLGSAALVFLIPMLPILAALIGDMLTEGDFIQRGLGFADVFSSDVLGFFVPSHLHPFFGDFESQFHFAYINFAYLGMSALALAFIALWTNPKARIWGVFGIIFILITLGPNLRVNGTAIDAPFLPFNFLLDLPFVKGNRYPSRWSVMVTLCLAILVGYGLAWVLKQVSSFKFPALRNIPLFAFCLLLSALLFEHLSLPLPTSNLQSPDVYKTIARDKDDFSVLELPLAWRNGFRMTGALDQAMMFAQFYQTEHRHPILGGNTSRNPELKFQYFTEAPVINSLIAAETGHALDDATRRVDKELAPAVLRFFGVRYVVWHSPRNPQNRSALDAARAYMENVLPLKKFYEVSDETGETVAYRVDETSLTQTLIRPNDPLARLNLAEGWGIVGGDRIWVTRREAKIFLRLDAIPTDSTFSFRAFVPMQNQRAALNINGHATDAVALRQGWGEYSVRVMDGAWRVGMNQVVFEFDSLVPVASVRDGNFVIGQTGVAAPVSIVARSAGSEVGDFAHIFIDGVDVSPNERGYNLVVIDPQTGAIESRAAFDTFASESESARLAQFIGKIPNGKIVAAAVRDEASRFLTEDAVSALRTIGAAQNLRGKFRWSHAIIGVRGAASGTALEFASETLPAQAVAGVGAMEPNVAGALEWIRLGAK